MNKDKVAASWQRESHGQILTTSLFFQVMSYSQLCSLLGVKQEDPKPSPLHTNVIEMKAFFSSPSGKRSKRRREDSTRDDRGSLVTTPTAELSTQEESLLDSFLDWSLDSCSGYEGDRESEGERDGDGKAYKKTDQRTQNLPFYLLCKNSF